MKRQSQSASDFLEELKKDEEYQKRLKATEEELAEKKRLSRIEQQKLLDDLVAVGEEVNDVWDLVNTKRRYPAAIPVLLKHLPFDNSDGIKEGIVRALTVREAKGTAGEALLLEFNKLPESKHHFRWAIGNAMTTVIDEADKVAVREIISKENDKTVKEIFEKSLKKLR